MSNWRGHGGDQSSVAVEGGGPANTGKLGDNVRETRAIGVSRFKAEVPCLPLSEADPLEGAVGLRELKLILEQFSGQGPAVGVDSGAA